MAQRQKLRDPRTATGPRRIASGTGSPAAGHERTPVAAFVRDPSLLRWIATEFRHLDAVLRITYSHTDMAACLLRDPPPRPRMLLVSIDELSSEELCALKRVRDGGWRGSVIALSRSRMLPALRNALGVDRLLTPPFVQDLFADILRERRAQDRREAAAAGTTPPTARAAARAAAEARSGYLLGASAAPAERGYAVADVVAESGDAPGYEGDDGDDATSRITTGSSSRYTATPADSVAESMANPSFVSSEVSSSIRTNRR